MAKGVQTRHVCRECGYETAKWLGKCPGCEAWGTLEETITVAPSRATQQRAALSTPGLVGASRPMRLSEIEFPSNGERASTGFGEFDRVLGGGIVAGALILVGGDPGIGKSTLLTQAAGYIAATGDVLYVSGEESISQIRLRTARLGIVTPNILVQNETDITRVAATIEAERPAVVIIDSIQTMAHPELEASPGSVSQVRASTMTLGQAVKSTGVPAFLVGHVTKEGALAGPRVLEHMVDTVLTFEGDRHYAYRILRAAKNRFGSTDELGIFEMHDRGLAEVPNPSELLLAERAEHATGSAVTAVVEGSRPLLVEMQALTAPSYLTSPRRTFSGVDSNRVNLILAVLEKRCGLRLGTQDVFVNVAGGVRVGEPAADLAIAVATASNYHERPADSGTIFVGEVGLGGEVRAVGHIEKRVREAARLGFRRAIIAGRNRTALARAKIAIELIGVDTLQQALDKALGPG
ncbi:MAG: DNA repair protein RadA [Capsulimonadaceae bacterium]